MTGFVDGVCPVAPFSSFKELKLREDLRLSDLEAAEPVHLPHLEVGRRQLYAAGSRGGFLSTAGDAQPPSSAPSPEEVSRELAERKKEEEMMVESWIKECASQIEGGNKTVSQAGS